VELRVGAAGGGEAEPQILQRRPAPVAVDRVGEGLAVTGAAVEIDGDRGIARRREQPRIPAIGPAVAEAALRPAMDQQRYRQPLGDRGLPYRLHDLPPDGVAMRAREGETLDRYRVEPGHAVGIAVGELRRAP